VLDLAAFAVAFPQQHRRWGVPVRHPGDVHDCYFSRLLPVFPLRHALLHDYISATEETGPSWSQEQRDRQGPALRGNFGLEAGVPALQANAPGRSAEIVRPALTVRSSRG